MNERPKSVITCQTHLKLCRIYLKIHTFDLQRKLYHQSFKKHSCCEKKTRSSASHFCYNNSTVPSKEPSATNNNHPT